MAALGDYVLSYKLDKLVGKREKAYHPDKLHMEQRGKCFCAGLDTNIDYYQLPMRLKLVWTQLTLSSVDQMADITSSWEILFLMHGKHPGLRSYGLTSLVDTTSGACVCKLPLDLDLLSKDLTWLKVILHGQ